MENHSIIYYLIRACYRVTVKPIYVYIAKKQSYNLLSKSVSSIKKIKNAYEGRRCFIIGNGPSLKTSDLEKLRNDICFASHGIYEIYDKTIWRPTYYCAQDLQLIRKRRKKINKQIESKKIIAIAQEHIYPQLTNAIFIKKIWKDFGTNLPAFSDNAQMGIYEGFTVTYMCLQLAVYMGFKEIILLGIDHNYSTMIDPEGNLVKQKGIADHFSKNDKITNLPRLNISTLAYQAAKKYADLHGIKIYNATRGGKLEVFERVNFDELFNSNIK